MSATGRGAERKVNDAYSTPTWVIHRLLDEIGEALPRGAWLEPCAGAGNIIRAADTHRLNFNPAWIAVDVADVIKTWEHPRVDRCHGDIRYMARGWYQHQDPRFRVAITNPPFSLAEAVIDACLPIADYVIMLLRTNYLESAKRAEFLRKFPPDVYVLPNRPSFTHNGRTDATSYAWFVWPPKRVRSYGRIRTLKVTPKEDRSA